MLVLGVAEDAGHWRLQDVMVGERFAFGGRVFETSVLEGELALRSTGDVLGRVYQTHVRQSDTVIDLVVSGPEGDQTITGTPEHPFWVDAVGDYVAMGALEFGTVLRTVGGDEARVTAMERRKGDFEVFNFEVEGVQNYFVSAPGGGDGLSVLVHNGCGVNYGGAKVPDLSHVNPTGSRTNCINCAVATDATLAGRPASALPRPVGDGTDLLSAFGKTDGDLISVGDMAGAEGAIDALGSSRGVVLGRTGPDSAHAFNYSNSGGNVSFLDGQTGSAANTTGMTDITILPTD